MPFLPVDNEITRLPEWDLLSEEEKDIITEFYFLRRRMHVVFPPPGNAEHTATQSPPSMEMITIDAANNSEQLPGTPRLDTIPLPIRAAIRDFEKQRVQVCVLRIVGRITCGLEVRGYCHNGLDFDCKYDLLYIAVPNFIWPLSKLRHVCGVMKGPRRLAIQTAPITRMLRQLSSFDPAPFNHSELPKGYPHLPSIADFLFDLLYDMENLEELYLVTMPYMGPPKSREPRDRWGFMSLPDYIRRTRPAPLSPIIVSFRRVVMKVQELLNMLSSHCRLHAVVDVDARRP